LQFTDISVLYGLQSFFKFNQNWLQKSCRWRINDNLFNLWKTCRHTLYSDNFLNSSKFTKHLDLQHLADVSSKISAARGPMRPGKDFTFRHCLDPIKHTEQYNYTPSFITERYTRFPCTRTLFCARSFFWVSNCSYIFEHLHNAGASVNSSSSRLVCIARGCRVSAKIQETKKKTIITGGH